MNLEDMIQDLKKAPKLNRVIIVNKKSSKYLKEFEKLNIEPINLSLELSQLVEGLPEEDKKHEGLDILIKFLESLVDEIIPLDNVQYVFSKEVGKINLLSRLNYFTREGKVVILLFNGKLIGNNLIYSEDGKEDHMVMDISQNEYVLGWDNEN